MRKEVQLPGSFVRDLKTLAFHADKSVKKMMEDILKGYVTDHIEKLKRSFPSKSK